MKATVYKQYGDAAIMSIVLEALPKVTVILTQPTRRKLTVVSFRSQLKSPHHSPRPRKSSSSVATTRQPPTSHVLLVKFLQLLTLWPVSIFRRCWASFLARKSRTNELTQSLLSSVIILFTFFVWVDIFSSLTKSFCFLFDKEIFLFSWSKDQREPIFTKHSILPNKFTNFSSTSRLVWMEKYFSNLRKGVCGGVDYKKEIFLKNISFRN